MTKFDNLAVSVGGVSDDEITYLARQLQQQVIACRSQTSGMATAISAELATALNALEWTPTLGQRSGSINIGPAKAATGSAVKMSALEKEESPRVESLVSLGDSNITFRVMLYRGQPSHLRPLVILNSVEYAMPPSIAFCEQMWANGLQVIFVERPGFGTSTQLPSNLFADDLVATGATASTEAVLIHTLLTQLQLKNTVLLGMGSANPVCYRLSMMSPDIDLSLYSNVVFNKDILDVFRPKWLQQMFRQMVQSKSGLKIASAGIKFRMRRKPLEFYRLLMHQSDGDVAYINANSADFIAAGQRFQSVDQHTIDYDFRMSLQPDNLLKDNLFAGCNAIAFSGSETPDHWQKQLNSEADRLAIPVAYAPQGDFLAPYTAPDFLISVIRENTTAQRSRL
ncbi:MAG: hypothetical protein NXH72_08645 [Hyphomonadaceae bacterium]|nr:hypothetical protein [Hyphomonadaceae bacterium]